MLFIYQRYITIWLCQQDSCVLVLAKLLLQGLGLWNSMYVVLSFKLSICTVCFNLSNVKPCVYTGWQRGSNQ